MALALRSIWSHKIKSLIVGSLMFFGSFLLVMGSAILSSIEDSMERSIVSSITGHLQVYDANARDELALFGGALMGAEDIGHLPDFRAVKETLLRVPGVKAVVPMGILQSTVAKPGELDRTLAKLREAVHLDDRVEMKRLAAQVRQIAEQLEADQARKAKVAADAEQIAVSLQVLDRATSDAFWAEFDQDPTGGLEYLDTQLAPISADGRMIWLRLLGVDLGTFSENFETFYVQEGEMVPPGKRGLMLSGKYYDKWLKNRVARDLDALNRGVLTGFKSIATDPKLESKARRLPGQYQRITFELDGEETALLEAKLRKKFPEGEGEGEGGLKELLQAFLTVNDDNIAERHAWFYQHIAPLIEVYLVPVGDTLTLRSLTKTGYLKAVNVKVYGTFGFEGLEQSDLAGAQNLIDMITFRELYGIMTERKKAELAEIKKGVAVVDLDRDGAEDVLFGGGADLFDDTGMAAFDEFADGTLEELAENRTLLDENTYTQQEIDDGIALNAAIILDDPEDIERMADAIEEAAARAGLELQVVDWREASGMIGQFNQVIAGVLLVAILIIFVVALFIINNSMVIAILERVTEIGTMRAIGAQRGFVVVMFLVETMVLALIAGGAGVGVAAGLVTFLGTAGIPAGGEEAMMFLFSGPYLYPTVGASQLAVGFLTILGVSLVSTLYPAYLAVGVQPIVAMQGGE